jgi:hypothetical protein
MFRSDPRLRIASLWVAMYLFVLSFGVSKVSNFIYPVMPVVALLLPATAAALWRLERFAVLVGLSATVIVTAVVFQWNLLGRASWLEDFPRWQMRPALVLFQCAIGVITVAALKFIRLPKPAVTSAATATLATLLVVTASLHANIAATHRHRRDYERQMALRQASLTLHPIVSDNDVVLVKWPGVRKSHLYVMYWSGIESFEITEDKPMEARMAGIPKDRHVFLLRDAPLIDGQRQGRSSASSALVRVR